MSYRSALPSPQSPLKMQIDFAYNLCFGRNGVFITAGVSTDIPDGLLLFQVSHCYWTLISFCILEGKLFEPWDMLSWIGTSSYSFVLSSMLIS